MKKRFSKVTAVALSAAMLFSASIPAYAASTPVSQVSGAVQVEVELRNPVYDVEIPMDTKVSLDPFSIGMDGRKEGIQAASPEYKVVNNSEVPVLVGFSLDITPADTNVKLVEKDGFVFGDGTSANMPAKGTINFTEKFPKQNSMDLTGVTNPKSLFFGVVSPTTIAYDTAATAPADGVYTDTQLLISYDTFSSGAMAKTSEGAVIGTKTVTTDTTLSFAFLLGKGTIDGTQAAIDDDDADTLFTDAAATADEARFKYYAQMNTYAQWLGNELGFEGVYKITGIDETTFKATPIGSTMLHGYNMYAVNPFTAFTGGFDTTVTGTTFAGYAGATAAFDLLFDLGNSTISRVYLSTDATGVADVDLTSPGDYAYNATDGEIQVTAAGATKINGMWTNAAMVTDKTLTINVVMADGNMVSITAKK